MRESDPIYGFWFFEAYYRSFGKQLSIISRKFMPETEAAVEELLSFTADMQFFFTETARLIQSNNVYLLLILANFHNI